MTLEKRRLPLVDPALVDLTFDWSTQFGDLTLVDQRWFPGIQDGGRRECKQCYVKPYYESFKVKDEQNHQEMALYWSVVNLRRIMDKNKWIRG